MFLCTGLVFIFIILFFSAFIGIERNSLKNIYYFLTNKRILSITHSSEGFLKKVEYGRIVNLLFINIDYYFFELIRNSPIPIYTVNFKTIPLTDNEIMNIFLNCYPLKDWELKDKYQVRIEREEEWILPSSGFVLCWKNIIDKEEISEILSGIFHNKLKNPPSNWKSKWAFGAHAPY